MNALAKLSRFFNKTFAFWVLVFGIIGYAFPDLCKPLSGWVTILLGIVMFGMGLTLTADDFREVFKRPRDVLIGILGQFLVMPLVAYALCLAFSLPPELAVGVMLVGCCPGGTASNVMTFLARGDVALSVTITSCTTLLAPFVTPVLMYVFASQWLDVNMYSMFLSIVEIVLFPIFAGIVVHKLLGHKIDVAVTCLPLISVTAIVLIVAAVVAASAGQIASAGALVFVIVVLHNGFGMLFGYLLAKVAGMNLAKRKCLSIEVGMQNSGLGVALATVHFAASPLSALPSAIFSFWHNISGPVMATIFHGWHEEGEEQSFFEKIEARAAAGSKKK